MVSAQTKAGRDWRHSDRNRTHALEDLYAQIKATDIDGQRRVNPEDYAAQYALVRAGNTAQDLVVLNAEFTGR